MIWVAKSRANGYCEGGKPYGRKEKMKSFFWPRDVREIVEVTYRQIQYWDIVGFIKPSHRRHERYRLYTFADLICFKIAMLFITNGMSVQWLKKSHMIEHLRITLASCSYPLEELQFSLEGKRLTVYHGDIILDTLSKTATRYSAKALRRRVNELYPVGVADVPLSSFPALRSVDKAA